MEIRKKVNFAFFCIILALLFVGCSTSGGKGTVDDRNQSVTGTEQNTEGSELATENISGLYEILGINTTNSTIKLYDLNRQRQSDYAYDDATYFLDKYGNLTSISQMQPGRIVETTMTRQTGPLMKVQISDAVWEYDNIKRFSIDEEKNIITIADTKYYYGEDLFVFSDEEAAQLKDIGKKDILRIIGIGKKIYSVSITSGHGVISLKNTDLFEGGWLKLGSKIYMKVTKDMQIEIAEGTYLLSVANDGYGDTKEITVNRGEELVVDLDELKGEGPKFCTVTFVLGVEDALVQIDGEYVDISQPIQIKYGIHKLVIDAEGYETWSKRLYVNSSEATIEIALTTESDSDASTETTEKSSSDTSTGTSESSSSSNSETSASTETESYLKIISEIIDTLTGGTSSSD